MIIPSDGFIENTVSEITDKFQSVVPINSDALLSVPTSSTDLSSIESSGDVAGVHYDTLIDTSYVVMAIGKFRPVIRGLVMFMLFIFNLNQVLMMFGASPLSLFSTISGSRGGDDN